VENLIGIKNIIIMPKKRIIDLWCLNIFKRHFVLVVYIMYWYSGYKNLGKIKKLINEITPKKGDKVLLASNNKDIDKFGIIYHLGDNNVLGWWADNKEKTIAIAKSKYNLESKPISQVYAYNFSDNLIKFVGSNRDFVCNINKNIVDKINKFKEVKAQSMYNLDIPFPSDLDNADSERIYTYENAAPNLWWGEGKYKWNEGKEDVIQGLPRYNPEYHDDEVGAYFTWWEPYIEPVPIDDLVNLQRSLNSWFFPGKYDNYELPARLDFISWEW